MSTFVQLTVTVVCAVLASSGLWAFIQKRGDSKDTKAKMLLGLAHDRVVYLGLHYIERGSITTDEYENLHDYLFKPYAELGGNGIAARIMEGVKKLPIKKGYEEND